MRAFANQGNRARRPRVVIVGGGFGGLYAAKGLKGAPVAITLLDRNNHHLFQPLLYQVATAGLSPEQIAAPIRSILSRQQNAEVVMAEVVGVDTQRQRVLTDRGEIPYDILVLATGSRHSYFGHEEWERFAPGLKEITDAMDVRQRILTAFEMAEVEESAEARERWLTFVLVGGGPTGVEMAGQIAEMARFTLVRDFRHIDSRSARIVLVEAGPRILPSFHPELSAAATRFLAHNGVEVRTGVKVTHIDQEGVVLETSLPATHGQGEERIYSHTVIWSAGNRASPAARWVGAPTDRMGRAKVAPDLSVPGHPEIFIIGDAAYFEQDGKPLPAVAPTAIQMGTYVAKVIRARVEGRPQPPTFRYFDKGDLATVGRHFAVFCRERGGGFPRVRLKGFIAWALWLSVHIYFLIGFANRLLVMLNWARAYFTYGRGARLIIRGVVCGQHRPSEEESAPVCR
ncbi:NADH dehydrogenase, FAD-containing subunit [Chthonomonas calidirosea]|uniref:NADH:ubiquinone reductase (non-electrogenic) n=1 Tax=Chthonomonas calidirosea (strain DSM 23976 / ICMP 18418 / T49) TaxID=1303518 RepID=S0EUQ1_CHTCT|nr:NAD(P)/FAD-dependent oxidoreductase [Chthonomonas calidirosea]CCW35094.1 NADH dehydrogenase, FAD-containing subunit [Chthonomonas calidirosea T49]CEK20889.1 NADH dehydrogenase, FAD-containing subunit [Chthonomonas calidirosea]